MAYKNRYRSVNLLRFFMKIIGLWYTVTWKERLIQRAAVAYAIFMLICAAIMEGADLYHCFGDFYALTYNLCASMFVVTLIIKFIVFILRYDLIMKLITYTEEQFWNVQHDEIGTKIYEKFDKKAVLMTCTFTFMVNGAVLNYIIAPVFDMKYANMDERVLPFKIWDFQVNETPVYEVAYFTQSLIAYNAGFSACGFDNFFCTFNVHVAAQLCILAQKIEVIVDKFARISTEETLQSQISMELRMCVHQHQTLIFYVEQMERAFTVMLFTQVLLSSWLICFGGFQCLAAPTAPRKVIFAFYFIGVLIEFLIIALSCNEIIVQSLRICDSAYNSKWYLLSNEGFGRSFKSSLMLIMIRARRPCVLTAGGFATLSLQTFTSISSTAVSYFTLLRQLSEEIP